MILIQTILNLRTSRMMLLPINLRETPLMRIRDSELLLLPLTPVSTEVYTSDNSVIYTGTSPTIFASSNDTQNDHSRGPSQVVVPNDVAEST